MERKNINRGSKRSVTRRRRHHWGIPWLLGLLVVVFQSLALSGAASAQPKIDIAKPKKVPLPKPETGKEIPIYIEADRITYDRQTNRYIAEGNVEIRRGATTLTADRVVLDTVTSTAVAEGNVKVVQDGVHLQSEQIEMNMDDQTGRIINGTIYFEPYNLTVTGREIQRVAEDRYRLVDATLSTCSGKTPDWRIVAKEAELTVGGYARVRHATFQVRKLPLLYFPYFLYPATSKRKSGLLLPEYRSSERFGQSITLPFYWAFHQSADATFFPTYFSERGFRPGLELRYAPWEALEGSVYGEYIRDQKDIEPEIEDRGGEPRKKRDRWRFTMWQNADLPGDVVSRASIDTVSDNYYLEDFSEGDERFLRYLTSTLNGTKRWRDYLMAGEAEYYRNLNAPKDDNGITPQKLPSLFFHRSEIPALGLPMTFGWNTTFDYLWRELDGTGEVVSFSPSMSLPLHLGPYASFVPFAEVEDRFFVTQDHPQADDSGLQVAYRYGGSLSTELARTYSVAWGDFKSVKHTLQPEIRFDGTDHFGTGDRPEDLMPGISGDPAITSTEFTASSSLPGTLFTRRELSDKLISIVLNQFLLGTFLRSNGELRFREFGYMQIVQSFSLEEQWRDLEGPEDERRPLLPLRARLQMRLYEDVEKGPQAQILKGPWALPRKFVYADLEGLFNWYDREMEGFSATVRGGDARGDELALTYRFINRETTDRGQIGSRIRIHVLPILDLIGLARYDHEANEFINYGYGFELHPQCWAIRFTHTIEPGYLGRETDNAFSLNVYLLGMGEVMKY
jgi:LPS-assembly protein